MPRGNPVLVAENVHPLGFTGETISHVKILIDQFTIAEPQCQLATDWTMMRIIRQ